MNRGGSRARRRAALAWVALAAAVAALPSCTPPQLLTLRSGLDSLRAVVDTLNVRDSLAFQVVQETRRELAEQRDIVLSTKATAGSTTNELFEQMQRLEGKLDEVMGALTSSPSARRHPPPGRRRRRRAPIPTNSTIRPRRT